MCEHAVSFVGCTLTSPEAAANAALCRRFIIALLDCGARTPQFVFFLFLIQRTKSKLPLMRPCAAASPSRCWTAVRALYSGCRVRRLPLVSERAAVRHLRKCIFCSHSWCTLAQGCPL